jgi:sterol desaturase/sphingolipid hydroxylase (fatty acid hydroxylase superfamily)
LTSHSFFWDWFFFFGVILIRYLIIAGGVYWLFYSVFGKSLAHRSLRRSPPVARSIYREIKLSALSAVVFAFGAACVITEYTAGITLLYNDLLQYGLGYLGISFVAILILQDTYFYLVHRLFHHPFFFKWIHFGHHRTGDPTPWTSFAFDFPEALVQAIFFVGIVLIIPLHFITLVAVLLTMTAWAVWNHLGFELFPAEFSGHWLGKWLIGSTHHAIHHRQYTVHYGLYFTFWDRVFGTQLKSVQIDREQEAQ